jgi:hypothetical protein
MLCFSICRFLDQLDAETSEPLKNYMAEQIRIVLRDTAMADEGDNIEVVNLLAVLKSFGGEYLLTPSELLSAYRVKLSENSPLTFPENNFGYFQVVTLLHYIENLPEYAHIKQALITHVLERFANQADSEKIQRNCELTLLFFDFLRCPYIDQPAKEQLASSVLKRFNKNNVATRISSLMNVVNKGDWFFSWDKKHDLGEILWKKELRSAY